MNTTESTRLLSIREAARQLGMGRTWLYELRKRGEIESVVISRRVLIPSDALDDYIARLRRKAA